MLMPMPCSEVRSSTVIDINSRHVGARDTPPGMADYDHRARVLVFFVAGDCFHLHHLLHLSGLPEAH